MINRKAAAAAMVFSAMAAALLLFTAAAMADGRGHTIARLIMADGRPIDAPMASRAACVRFTRAIALYVESANCETLARKETIS
jgi:hypothetical protein